MSVGFFFPEQGSDSIRLFLDPAHSVHISLVTRRLPSGQQGNSTRGFVILSVSGGCLARLWLSRRGCFYLLQFRPLPPFKFSQMFTCTTTRVQSMPHAKVYENHVKLVNFKGSSLSGCLAYRPRNPILRLPILLPRSYCHRLLVGLLHHQSDKVSKYLHLN